MPDITGSEKIFAGNKFAITCNFPAGFRDNPDIGIAGQQYPDTSFGGSGPFFQKVRSIILRVNGADSIVTDGYD